MRAFLWAIVTPYFLKNCLNKNRKKKKQDIDELLDNWFKDNDKKQKSKAKKLKNDNNDEDSYFETMTETEDEEKKTKNNKNNDLP